MSATKASLAYAKTWYRSTVKRRRTNPEINRDAERDCPPITTVYLTREGVFIHACKNRLDYLRAEKAGDATHRDTQVVFWCSKCLEKVYVAILALPRLALVDTDRDGSVRHLFPHLGAVGVGVQAPAVLPVESRLLADGMSRENPICRTCGLHHYLAPGKKK